MQNVSIAGLWNETSNQTLPVTTLMNQVGPSFSGDAFRALLTYDSRPTRLSLRSTNGMPSVNPSSMHTPPPSGDESRISTLPYFFVGNMGLRKARLGMTLSLQTGRLLKTGHCPICLDRATTRARMRSISIRERHVFSIKTVRNLMASALSPLNSQNAGTYDSREEYFAAPSSPPFGFSDGRLAVHARSPDMVIPRTSTFHSFFLVLVPPRLTF